MSPGRCMVVLLCGLDTKMSCGLLLLPTILTEAAVATLSSGKGKKRSFWKPSAAESMSYFIDIQRVSVNENHCASLIFVLL